jgi:hypothetical protein
MERGSTKHGPHLDEQMSKEVRAQTQGASSGSRTQEWYEAEPVGGDEPGAALRSYGSPPGSDGSPTPEEIAARSELGRWIPRSVLPGTRERLLVAMADSAPAPVIDQVRSLPEAQTFETVFEVWEALGHANEARA